MNEVNSPHNMKRSLRDRLIRSVGANGASLAINSAFRVLRSVFLARMLVPKTIGIFGFALTLVDAGQTLTNFGFKLCFLSRKGLTAEEEIHWLDTTWCLEILRGLTVFVLMALCGWPAASWLDQEDLGLLVASVAASIWINSFASPGIFQLQKQIRQFRIAVWEVSSSAVELVIVIGLVAIFPSAITLGVGLLLASFGRVFLSFLLTNYRPKFRIDRKIAQKSFHFGKYLLLVAMLTYATTQLDNLVVGKILGMEALGFYYIAYHLAMFPLTMVAQITSRVALPAYSEVFQEQGRRKALEKWFEVFVNVSWLLLSCISLLFIGRPFIISFLYGEQWQATIPVFGVLLFVAFLRSLTHLCTPMLLALDRPDIDAKPKTVEAVVFVACLFLLVPSFGVLGAAYAGVISYGLAFSMRLLFLAGSGELRRPVTLASAKLGAGVTIAILAGTLFQSAGVLSLLTASISALAVLGIGCLLERRFRQFVSHFFLFVFKIIVRSGLAGLSARGQ